MIAQNKFKDLSPQILIDYIFKSLSADDEKQLEAFLDENPDYADLTEGLLDLCIDNQFNRAELVEYLKESKDSLIAKVNSEISTEAAPSLIDIAKKEINYTIDQLKEFFSPVPYYESLILAGVSRSDDSIVLKVPRNEEDIKGNISFQLESPIDSFLTIKIEDSSEEVMWEKIIPPNTTSFEIPLKISRLHPGKYYWKMCVKKDVKIGTFYIDKKLDPYYSEN